VILFVCLFVSKLVRQSVCQLDGYLVDSLVGLFIKPFGYKCMEHDIVERYMKKGLIIHTQYVGIWLHNIIAFSKILSWHFSRQSQPNYDAAFWDCRQSNR